MMQTDTWRSWEGHAVHHRVRGRPAQAIPFLEQAIAQTRGVPELANDTATMLNYLADTCLCVGRLDQAESAIREALSHTTGEPLFHAPNLLILARILHGQQRQREAAEAGREGLRLVRQEYGWEDPYTLGCQQTLDSLGIAYTKGWFLGIVPPRITFFFDDLWRIIAKLRSRFT